ncbi:uncharacterized protein EDB91DRAFT_1110824 [Suillus paluster]|uniref:uncharacterized protein n=1 Tax=Suillus paluster TaxID=48578 RepID=UPI001B86F419|nr:uncharacterized protein EDB91DRAFT_1110824 [Suillus paluster]KAG1749998.1 hypothetical protein EDB91DRAFT_1110824 [Suillus paluster]
MAHPASGIVAWTTSIRTSMAKDSCRQLFEDQVQTHGFIFLDDYLENILAGPKQEPIIELVKTPARKKTAPKRTRAATLAAAKAQNAILLSLEEEDISKENQSPVNSFHKTLLQAKQNAEAMRSHADSDLAEQVLPEPEPAGTIMGEHVGYDPDLVEDDLAPEVENTMVYSQDTFHSIPLGSPKPTRDQKIRTGNHTQPLPQIPVASSPITHARDAFTAPLPILPASSSAPALTTMVVPLNDSPSRTLAHKSSVLQFPTLRAPSPLRKSMRAIEPSTGTGILPSTTAAPAQPPALGKRTSWLMKAREVKAMEGIVPSKTSILGSGASTMGPSSHTVAPLKRKSGDMLAAAPLTSDKTDEGRRAKVAKASESDSAPQNSKDTPILNQETAMPTQALLNMGPARALHLPEERWEPLNDKEDEASFMGVFKRTVEGLGARAGKSMGKSLGGGAAAVALAEARAAAEARVAERNKITGEDVTESEDPSGSCAEEPRPTAEDVYSRESEHRLSLSDIVSTNENPVVIQSSSAADESVSTTPPNSPPPTRTSGSSFVPPPGPVFNKPPLPVFMPPTSKQPAPLAKEFSFNLPITTFTLPPPISLGLPARLASPLSPSRHHPQAGGTQSSQASTFSDAVFDRVEDIPAWMPSTQDTEYTDGTESQIHQAKFAALEDDDDDSWPLEEKLAASEQGWTPFIFNNKEDSMTWSTLPTESQGPTRTTGNSAKKEQDEGPAISGAFAMDIDSDGAQVQDNGTSVPELEADHESDMHTSDLGAVIKAGQSAATLVESGDIPRSHSQLSMASTSSSSQSQTGFFGQATKLVNSMLGTGKKAKPEVKSLQLAAAAAKKQEEEANKKATRLKEMEARRQAALACKADKEKARAVEEEKKIKEESEKRKRERDETTEKRPLKTTAALKKVEEDATKKRKITVDEKKPEVKKPPSKDKKDTLPPSKLAKSSLATPATKLASASKTLKVPAPSALVSSATYNTSQNAAGSSAVKSAGTEAKTGKVGPPKGKAKAVPQENEDNLPSAMVQNQMAARAMAQIRAAKQQPPEIPSESIELPDINSEYSDSEDEDRVRTFDPPDWAQSPELRQALQMQSTVDPDDIFGAIRPLRMEEIFRTRQSRFRARSSSANWSGTDRLTVEEERDYARRMGFTKHTS